MLSTSTAESGAAAKTLHQAARNVGRRCERFGQHANPQLGCTGISGAAGAAELFIGKPRGFFKDSYKHLPRELAGLRVLI